MTNNNSTLSHPITVDKRSERTFRPGTQRRCHELRLCQVANAIFPPKFDIQCIRCKPIFNCRNYPTNLW